MKTSWHGKHFRITIGRSSLYTIICRNRLDTGSIWVTLTQHRNISCAYDLSCYCYSCLVLFNQERFGFNSLACFLKLIIAAGQYSSVICNACRYCSVLMVYCVDIIWWNHFTAEICGFCCVACHCFYRYTDVCYCVFLIIYWSVILYEYTVFVF